MDKSVLEAVFGVFMLDKQSSNLSSIFRKGHKYNL